MTDSEQIEREVEMNRANVESTLDKLKDRMSVEQIVDEVGRFIGMEDARGTLQAAGRQVRENPLALGMIGLGVAWLVMGKSDGKAGNHAYGRYRAASTDWDRPRRQVHSGGSNARGVVGETANDMMSRGRDAVSGAKSMADDAMHQVSDMADAAQDRMHSAVDSTMETARNMRGGIADQMERQPLIAGAIALAVGAVIGAALPRTQTEDRMMGDSRDQMLNRAKGMSRDAADRATEMAQTTYGAAVDAAKDEGLLPTGDASIASRLGTIAGVAVDTATDEVETALRGEGDEDMAHKKDGDRDNKKNAPQI
jgi:ElaB/YqjD/DUF883 family membrane-anchored ribosome-binding protein